MIIGFLHAVRFVTLIPAVILDVFSRRVIGYAISARLDSSLAFEALHMAIAGRRLDLGVSHYSDQGAQYASTEYVGKLERHGFSISMTRRGSPYENAVMESFFKTLKQAKNTAERRKSYGDSLSAHYLTARGPQCFRRNPIVHIKSWAC